MDAITLLKQDHARVQELFDSLASLGHGAVANAQKEDLVRRVIHELSIHAAIEEQVFYPSLKARDPALAEPVNEALEEHRVAKWELAALEKMDPEEPRFDAKLAVLMESVRHHIREEERELFPELRRRFATDELQVMGRALALAKQVVPTHPHPRMPDEPPGNAVVGPLFSVVDRSRDLLAGLLERGAVLAQDVGQRLRHRTGRWMRHGRARATLLSREAQARVDEAQGWVQEAPARALGASSELLEGTREVLAEARDTARVGTEWAAGQRTARGATGASRRGPGGRAAKGGAAKRTPAKRAAGRTAAKRTGTAAGRKGRVSRPSAASAGRTGRQRTRSPASKAPASKAPASKAPASKAPASRAPKSRTRGSARTQKRS